MVQVTRKDEREANENIIRRFNRKVLQSGVLAEAKTAMRFSETEQRVFQCACRKADSQRIY